MEDSAYEFWGTQYNPQRKFTQEDAQDTEGNVRLA